MDPKSFRDPKAGQVIHVPFGYWAFVPSRLPPEITWTTSLVSALAEAERDLSALNTTADAFPFPRLLIHPFVRNEAVLSSRIEGTRASFLDVYAFETTQLSFFERTDDTREVINYVRAMEFGFERLKSFPISLRFFRELHQELLRDVRGGTLTPGEFRRSQNWIGPVGSTPSTAPYVPPPVEEMLTALDALESFIHSDRQTPSLARIAMIHYQFEAIHPFLDGNGRLGRLLIPLLLSEIGALKKPLLNISEYFERYRQQYYELLLGISQTAAWEPWLVFFFRGISEQARVSLHRIEHLQNLRTKYQAIVEENRNAPRMAAVVDFLFSHPLFTIRQVSQELGIPFKTAGYYLNKLVEKGLLRETTGYSRNRIFQADTIVNIILGLDPDLPMGQNKGSG